jgi:hypothetical protein
MEMKLMNCDFMPLIGKERSEKFEVGFLIRMPGGVITIIVEKLSMPMEY